MNAGAVCRESPPEPGGRSVFVSAPDGLRLHVRCYAQATDTGIPVVCLPGLARTALDFDVLARALSEESTLPHRVYALDYRGRGRSERDRDPSNYNLSTELADLLAVLTALEIGRAVFVGTSRGGLLTMLLATARPGAIAAAILNDVGPVIEPQGLARIKGYVGKLPQPSDFEDAATLLRRMFGGHFPALTEGDWRAYAYRSFESRNGRLVSNYDPRLSETLSEFDPEKPVPAWWNQFEALAAVPLMVIRGAHSDILSPATVQAMHARHKAMVSVEVPGQGHAPLLAEPVQIERIALFMSDLRP